MNITNIFGLPEALVSFASEEYEYEPKVYRATSLLKGYKEIMLTRKFYNDVSVDVSDLIFQLWGSAVHLILEQQPSNNTVKEERLYMKFGDYTLTGKFDEYEPDNHLLRDYKTTSVYKIVYKNYDDWKKQGQIYAMLMEHNNNLVDKFEVVAFLKDHSKNSARYSKDYPILPVHKILFDISKEDISNINEWVSLRFKQIEIFESMDHNEIPPCTEEERWTREPTYALMKEGRKAALKVEKTEHALWVWAENNLKDSELQSVKVERRPGSDVKCESYCIYNQFCNYYLDKGVRK
jgi:hypothetical protein